MELYKYQLINEQKYEEVLDNGLKVIIVPKKGFKRTYVALQTNFGANILEYKLNNKKYTIPKGSAHFLEHILFSNDNKDITNEFALDGLEVNAFTTYNNTCFYFSGLENINKGINNLLNFVQKPNFNKENIVKEREVILQELYMYKDDVSQLSYLGIKENLYNKHPIVYDICGTEEDIRKININILKLAYNHFYIPSNMVMFICGDVFPNNIINTIKNNQLNKKINNNNIKDIIFPLDNYINTSSTIFFDNIKLTKVSIGIKLSIQLNNDINDNLKHQLIVKLFFEILLGADTDFYQKLIDDKVINSQYSFDYYLDNNICFYLITVDTERATDFIALIKERVLNWNSNIFNNNILEKKKKILYGHYLREFESCESIMINFLNEYPFNNDFFQICNLINEIVLDEVIEIGFSIKENLISSFIIKPNS